MNIKSKRNKNNKFNLPAFHLKISFAVAVARDEQGPAFDLLKNNRYSPFLQKIERKAGHETLVHRKTTPFS